MDAINRHWRVIIHRCRIRARDCTARARVTWPGLPVVRSRQWRRSSIQNHGDILHERRTCGTVGVLNLSTMVIRSVCPLHPLHPGQYRNRPCPSRGWTAVIPEIDDLGYLIWRADAILNKDVVVCPSSWELPNCDGIVTVRDSA